MQIHASTKEVLIASFVRWLASVSFDLCRLLTGDLQTADWLLGVGANPRGRLNRAEG
jgi:hypothetical protein